jgi:DNA polymerase (family 10)
LFEELGIDSLHSLRAAATEQRIRTLKGFGPKAEEGILAALNAAGAGERRARMVLDRALAVGEPLAAALREHPASQRVELAGSARRWADSVKDLDVIATASDPRALAEAAAALDLVESANTPADAGVRLRTHTGMPVDLRIVEPDQFGNLLQHLTGSKQHNMALRDAAVRKGLHVSEYGVLDDATGRTHRCATEAEVYALLGLEYIEPELRENRGELEAAAAGTLPDLIEVGDLRGDLHCHTTASDGTASIEEMALAARDAGYRYLAITDHSASFGFGDDLSPDRLREHVARIRTTHADGIKLLAGSEVNVLPDGSLDYADEILAELDWVVASVHSSFRMSKEEMTARIVRAVEHPLVDVLGHPSGRKVEQRAPYEFDVELVIEAAARSGTMLEINSNPDRRDLNEIDARAAAAAGIPIVINTDAHRVRGFEAARYGVATARRAWLTAAEVANTRPWDEVAGLRPRHR